MLLENGVPSPDALELTAAAVNGSSLATALTNAAGLSRQGVAIDQALKQSRYCHGMSGRLVSLVESVQQSGHLPDALRAVAESFESQVQTQQQLLEVVIGPLFFLLIAFGAGTIVLAYMMPLLSLINALGSGHWGYW
jgi:type IV pilus assembly protein PilC